MDQPRPQTAEIRGHGNLVVQIIGDGNVTNLVPSLPALWLTTYESPLHAEVPTAPPGAGQLPGYTATGKEEAALLIPYTRSLTMVGRDPVLRDLTAWLEAPSPISVQVAVGAGGRGKTRLALELCVAAKDWHAGFVTGSELTRFRAQQAVATWGWNRPVLVVVDYAAAKADAIAGWLAELTHHAAWRDPAHPKLRLLLLERYGAPGDAWWRRAFDEDGSAARAIRRMLAPEAPIRIGPIAEPAQRQAVFAEAYRLARGAAPPAFANLDRLLETQSLGGEPLFLAMSGLTAARIGMASALAQTPDALAIGLARDELRRVRAIWSGRGLPVSTEKRLDHHLVALATLCEGLSEAEAHAVIARECEALHLAAEGGTERFRAALHAALPGEASGIAPILPDILGEAAMIAAWGDGPQGVAAVQRAAADRRDGVTRVVIRACQDFLVRGHRAPLVWLRVLREGIADLDALMRLGDAMPHATTELREAALEVAQTIADLAAARTEQDGSEFALAMHAVSLNNLSVRLSDLGRREAALAAIEEAVAIRRGLAAARPDAFAPDLALSLNNLSGRLSNLGRREAALAAIEEAVAIHRGLAAARPDAFAPDLASSLNNLSGCLSNLGRREAALAAIEEAVAIRRGLAAARPDAFAPDLALSLNNLSNCLSELGRREAALAAIEEAVAIRRGLAAARPDAFAPDLALSLNNLSNCLSELGRREAALAAIEEAVATYRGLAAARPDAFAPDLAGSLNNLSIRLSDLGRREAALAAIEEAVAIRRGLAAARPDAFAPDLATSLNNLSNRLSDLGRREAALAAIEEAVATYRGLAAARPDAFAPDLAMALNNLSGCLSDLGRREVALAAVEEAVAIRRGLAAARPDAFAPDLASSLGAQGQILSETDPLRAASSFEEGIRVLAGPFLALPAAFAPLMATLCRDYLGACEAAGRPPDEALLGPIAAVLMESDRDAPGG